MAYPERRCARRCDSSPQPGLIEVKPRRGATVANATSAQLETLFAAMAEIEATCARLAAMSMTPIERRRLHNLHETMAASCSATTATPTPQRMSSSIRRSMSGAHNSMSWPTSQRDCAGGSRPFGGRSFAPTGASRARTPNTPRSSKPLLACDAAAAHARDVSSHEPCRRLVRTIGDEFEGGQIARFGCAMKRGEPRSMSPTTIEARALATGVPARCGSRFPAQRGRPRYWRQRRERAPAALWLRRRRGRACAAAPSPAPSRRR